MPSPTLSIGLTLGCSLVAPRVPSPGPVTGAPVGAPMGFAPPATMGTGPRERSRQMPSRPCPVSRPPSGAVFDARVIAPGCARPRSARVDVRVSREGAHGGAGGGRSGRAPLAYATLFLGRACWRSLPGPLPDRRVAPSYATERVLPHDIQHPRTWHEGVAVDAPPLAGIRRRPISESSG